MITPRIGLAFLALGASLLGCRRNPSCEEHDPISVELCGPRREWVGPWQSGDGVYLDIGPHGGFRYLDHRPHHFREVQGDIVGFEGQDMAIQATDGAKILIRVTSAPHDDGKGFSMTAEGVDFGRGR